MPWVHVLQMGKTSGVVSQKEKEVEHEIKRQKANKLRARELERQGDCVKRNIKCGRKNLTEKKIDIEKTTKASLAKLSQL